ncbi:hypothetical protein [Paractinoplanes toevensis]|uniref:Uncharacterized protein n=1 Tax=Paractinoplanes toevensis TaxID=571911 RepID=A0A919T3T3_9ACTN|nr:hypothetical protein [Actinoplanes toevensis]GIM88718.1 hypothetical protein Ato02nite_005110 [Actinoplanes toevensis]
MQEPPNTGPDDWYFDEHSQRWLRHSGRARWRRILAEKAAWRAEHPEELARLRGRFSVLAITSRLATRASIGGMTQETSSGQSMRDLLVGMGVVVTDEGVERARQRLRDADADLDREGRAALLAKLRQGPAAFA